MWKATDPDGSLTYNFLDSIASLYPYYKIRFAAGIVYFVGIILFAWNIFMTIRTSKNNP